MILLRIKLRSLCLTSPGIFKSEPDLWDKGLVLQKKFTKKKEGSEIHPKNIVGYINILGSKVLAYISQYKKIYRYSKI